MSEASDGFKQLRSFLETDLPVSELIEYVRARFEGVDLSAPIFDDVRETIKRCLPRGVAA